MLLVTQLYLRVSDIQIAAKHELQQLSTFSELEEVFQFQESLLQSPNLSLLL